MTERYLSPTQSAGRDFVMRQIEGPVTMLNLLRFRELADYSQSPNLAPATQISGKDAYQLYIEHTLPFLEAAGGQILFMGKGGAYLIGPSEERWDSVLLIQQKDSEAFLNFANDKEYLKGLGHRTAALEDSRLLPIEELDL